MTFTRRVKDYLVVLALAAPVIAAGITYSPPSSATPVPTTVRHLTTRVDVLKTKLAIAHRHKKWYEAKITKLHYRIDHPNTPTHTSTSSSSSTSTPTSTTSYNGSTSGWGDELAAAGFPSSAIPHMLYIIDRESGGCPTAVNGLSGCPSYSSAASFLAASTSHACGLIQAYPCSGGAAWLDPMTNLRVGYQKYAASGFAPWGG